MAGRFYATTPIYYVNDKPHIGHAYCTILADAARRYRGLLGDETYFCTGTDEHGQKVQQAAERRGISPQDHVDDLHGAFKALLPEIGCAPDQFIRTTETRHARVVQRALQQIWSDGLVEAREFEGWYSTAAERYWTEKDLVDGMCPDTGQAVVRLKEKNYFFLMSRFQDRLIAAVESGEMRILPPGRANEVLGFLREPLQDLCISRPKSRLSWGIELPFDTDYVTYVWFDALLNYVTAIGGLGAAAENADQLVDPWRPAPASHAATSDGDGDGDDDGDTFATWWPAVHHFLGKDILTTHAIYWPTMLMALGLPVPSTLVVTGWWLTDNTKMSKSLGNVVSPLSLKDKYGAEVLRYFLLREMAVGQDANFSEAALVGRNNTDLANDLGNLVQRVLTIVERNFGGHVPNPQAKVELSETLTSAVTLGRFLVGEEVDLDAFDAGQASPVAQTVATMKLHVTIADTMSLVARLNQVMTADAPFKLVKTDRKAAATIVYHVLEGIRVAANLLWPIMPNTCVEILERIGWSQGPVPIARLKWGGLSAGAVTRGGTPLFPKYTFGEDEADTVGAGGGAKAGSKAGAKAAKGADAASADPAFTFDDFMRMELRVGRVIGCTEVPKSNKLVKMQVDVGEDDERQILAGVRPALEPDDLINQLIVVLCNLPPRKIMGAVSEGMMLVAEGDDGELAFLRPAADSAPGNRVR